jgi:hypothetical protein
MRSDSDLRRNGDRAVKPEWASTDMNGIKVLAAAYLALNQVGEGSSPSSPTDH